ncbi:MAG: TerC family protein, partial [Candidatus Methylomirabilis sp.]|nr:TerC family protein [Deltaproteobacteria bacterium]
MHLETVGSPALWFAFGALVLCVLFADVLLFHREDKVVGFGAALGWTLFWVSLSLSFGGFVHWRFGGEKALEYLAGYLVEQSLSVDNLFVFLVVFKSFALPRALEHRVLYWGILGALVLRLACILAGAALIQAFDWIFYVFGAILLFTGVRLLFEQDEDPHPEKHPVLRLLRRFIPTVGAYHGNRFFIEEAGKRFATPLFIVLLTIEMTDVVFAVDSIPAVFGVTRDPFIVYTSNIFAILGLRSLYFLLAGAMDRLHYLKYGLALVLL